MANRRDELVRRTRMGEDLLLELDPVRFSGSRIVGPWRDNIADELAAFANARGGVVALGVDDRAREGLCCGLLASEGGSIR